MAEGSVFQADSTTWHNTETEEIIESGSEIRVRICSVTGGHERALGSVGGAFLGLASAQS
jgi:DNA-directed RNA polymerase subunit E'/Rpb7